MTTVTPLGRTMTPMALAFAGALTVAALAGPPANASSPETGLQVDEATLDQVREHAERHRTELEIPGLALGIVHGGDVVLLEGFGRTRAGGKPIRPDTPFFLASMSKPLTALAVMQLVDEGRIELDAPAATYLPELGAELVTVRDLLHHRTGLSTYDGRRSIYDPSGTDLAVNVQRLGPSLRANAPFEYSNANYDALALLVERASGTAFERFMHEQIFAPLEMRSSYLDVNEASSANLAQGHYRWLFLGYQPHDAPMPAGMAGSATMFSSVEDLTRLLTTQLDGGSYDGRRIVSEEAVRAMHEPIPHQPGAPGGYGLGWWVRPAFPPGMFGDEAPAGTTLVIHGGQWPTYHGVMWMVPEADLGFVMLANANDLTDEPAIGRISGDVRAILFGLDPPETTFRSPLLLRWSKPLLLALVLGQLLLAARTVSILARRRRGTALRRSDRTLVGAATLLDLTMIGSLLWMSRRAFEAPVLAALSLPDFRILLTAAGVGLAWGVVRTALAGAGLVRRRPGAS